MNGTGFKFNRLNSNDPSKPKKIHLITLIVLLVTRNLLFLFNLTSCFRQTGPPVIETGAYKRRDWYYTSGLADPNFNKIPAFTTVINKHDRYLCLFKSWRRLFSKYSEPLADLVKRFPETDNLDWDSIRKLFADGGGFLPSLKKDVFSPWQNIWSGQWSNGVTQYHIWGAAKNIDNRIIQPVTLSEHHFIRFCCVSRKAQEKLSDIAINVFSQETGITGWVSKTQHGKLEMPHVGYLINDTTLVWIAQIKNAKRLSNLDRKWFIFLESVRLSTIPRQYSIYGVSFSIGETLNVDIDQMGKHQGIYYEANPELPLAEKNRIPSSEKIGRFRYGS